jgi:hypothetical protein
VTPFILHSRLLPLSIITIAVLALFDFQPNLTQSRHVLLWRIGPDGLGGWISFDLSFIRPPLWLIKWRGAVPVIGVFILCGCKPAVRSGLAILVGLDSARRAAGVALVLAMGAIGFCARPLSLFAGGKPSCLISGKLDQISRTL